MIRNVAALAGAAFLIAGCAAPSAAPLPSATLGAPARTSAATAPQQGTARFSIYVPRRTASPHRPRFVSDSTKSLLLTISTAIGAPPVVSLPLNIVAGNGACSFVQYGVACSISVGLHRRSYVASVNTYDRINEKGHLLSFAQNVPFTITYSTTSVGMTLDGVPHAINVFTASYAIVGSQAKGYTIYGGRQQAMIVNAVDADGNAIVGPGSPSIVPAVASGTGWSIVTPAPSLANGFLVGPPAVLGATASIRVTASYANPAVCTQKHAVCSTHFSITNHTQRLFVANGDGSSAQTGLVTMYAPPYTGTPATIVSGTAQPQVLLLDSHENLWVAQCDLSCTHSTPDRIEEYAPPWNAAPAVTITSGVSLALGLAVDTTGNVFASYYNANQIGYYPPPYNQAPLIMSTGLNRPTQLQIGSGGTVWAANSLGTSVLGFQPPFTTAPVAVKKGVGHPAGILFDPSWNLFVSNAQLSTVTIYAPPYTKLPAQTITTPNCNPGALAFDSSLDLFVACPLSNSVLVYAPPYTITPTVITNGIAFPIALAVDEVGNLFVANNGGINTVTQYAPPYTAAPIATITNSLKIPQSLALSP